MKEIVHTYNLTKKYDGSPCVNKMEMKVMEQEIYGFLGPNGAGKTTTLKMLLGLTKPTEGKIRIFNEEFNQKNRIQLLQDIGSLIENPSYYGHLTAKENLKILQTLLNVPSSNIDKVLEIVRLKQHQNKKVSKYSLGMKQRLGIAAAMIGFPKLLILDEPTNGLDPAGIHEIRNLICSLPKQYGMTVIVSSHLLSEIEQMIDTVGIIANGNLLFQDSLAAFHNIDTNKSMEEIFLTVTRNEVSL